MRADLPTTEFFELSVLFKIPIQSSQGCNNECVFSRKQNSHVILVQTALDSSQLARLRIDRGFLFWVRLLVYFPLKSCTQMQRRKNVMQSLTFLRFPPCLECFVASPLVSSSSTVPRSSSYREKHRQEQKVKLIYCDCVFLCFPRTRVENLD